MKTTGAVSKTTPTTTTKATTAGAKALPRVEPSTSSSPSVGTFGVVADPSTEKFFECNENAVLHPLDAMKSSEHECVEETKADKNGYVEPVGDYSISMDGQEEEMFAFFAEGLEDDFDPSVLP